MELCFDEKLYEWEQGYFLKHFVAGVRGQDIQDPAFDPSHAALREEFGATPWWHGGGSLEWEPESGRAAQRENIEQLLAWGYAAEWIDRNQVLELEPDIDPAAIGDAPVAYFPEEGWREKYATALARTDFDTSQNIDPRTHSNQ